MISKRPKVFLAIGSLVTIIGMIGAWYVRFNAQFKDDFNSVYVPGWKGFSAAEIARMDQHFAAFVVLVVVGFCLAAVATYILFRKSRSRVANGKNK